MPATETLIALSALGPALFKASVPATAALSASGVAAVPATSAPATGFAVASAAGSGATCCGIKALSTALLLTKKGGATLAAKAGSGFLSLTKGTAPAAGGSTGAGGSAVSLPFSAATTAGPNPATSGSLSSYSTPHIGGSTPLHHVSPVHNYARTPGLGAGNSPPRNPSPLDTSAGGLPTHSVRHNPVAGAGGNTGGSGPLQPASTHHPSHYSAAGGGGEASNGHRHLRVTRPQPTGPGHSHSEISKPRVSREVNSHSRRIGNAPFRPVSATDPADVSPTAAVAEQAGGQQPPGNFMGAASHETTVISTLVGIALLRWAVSSLCCGTNRPQVDASAREQATAADITYMQKTGAKETDARVCAEVANVKRPPGQWSGRRVERWKRDVELFVDEGSDFERAAFLSKLREETGKHPQSSDQEVAQRPPILEVCLSECEGDDPVIAQGEAVETFQDYKAEWHFPDPTHASEQLLPWRIQEDAHGKVEKNADWPTGGLNARRSGESQSRLECVCVSDTTLASSRSADELCAISDGLTKKKHLLALQEAFHHKRSGGRIASFL